MMNAIQAVLSRMMGCDDELRQDLVAPCGDFMLPVLIGHDDRASISVRRSSMPSAAGPAHGRSATASIPADRLSARFQ
jgi:hypothetical protein